MARYASRQRSRSATGNGAGAKRRCTRRLLKTRRSVILRSRRFCAWDLLYFSTRKQQILRSAQDDTLGERFFSSDTALGILQGSKMTYDVIIDGTQHHVEIEQQGESWRCH